MDEHRGEDDENATAEAAGPNSLLPYDEWTETALRQVAVRALSYAAEHGLPGEHHFYLTFRTDHPACVLPNRLRAQYPQEMTIVLQHKFWNLIVDEEADRVSVDLSFGGVPATLQIPFGAMVGFADPSVQYGLRFRAETPPEPQALLPGPEPESAPETATEPATEPAGGEAPQVVSLDAFRRRPPPKG